ncbi:hypothetical protein RRG08_051718 [Elysia crispata]|uniref:Uncharacterized protein n=1 Tax=Elysia crispata TaxID=231223 RepID=A0AAE1EEH6_9GAST|nr:hypothetical protein RRG08_051718 [Elysia crispata]
MLLRPQTRTLSFLDPGHKLTTALPGQQDVPLSAECSRLIQMISRVGAVQGYRGSPLESERPGQESVLMWVSIVVRPHACLPLEEVSSFKVWDWTLIDRADTLVIAANRIRGERPPHTDLVDLTTNRTGDGLHWVRPGKTRDPVKRENSHRLVNGRPRYLCPALVQSYKRVLSESRGNDILHQPINQISRLQHASSHGNPHVFTGSGLALRQRSEEDLDKSETKQ